MKKIVVPYGLREKLGEEGSILGRGDIVLYTATTADKVLALHRDERMDLIVLDIRSCKASPESFVAGIRRDPALRRVSIILVGRDTEADRVLSSRGGANAFFPARFDPREMLGRMGQLLSIPERKSYRALLRVAVKASLRRDQFMAVSRNISVHGILIECARALRLGDVLSMAFTLPRPYEVLTEGVVVREAPGEGAGKLYGVEFTGLHPEDRLAVEEFVESFRPPGPG